jgi:hypothetical protein
MLAFMGFNRRKAESEHAANPANEAEAIIAAWCNHSQADNSCSAYRRNELLPSRRELRG